MSPAAKMPADAGFQILVHRYAPIRLNSGMLGKIDPRLDADPDHDQVGCDGVAVLERHFARVDRGHALLQMEYHTVAFVQAAQVFAHLWPEHRRHRYLFRRDDVNFELSLNQCAATSIAMKLAPTRTMRLAFQPWQ